MRHPRALVVDDEPDIRELLSITLGRMDIAVETAGDYGSAVKRLGGERYDLVLTDMRLPDGDGLDLVAWIQEHRPGVPVAVITAHGNVEAAVRALKLGAFDFLSKPLDLGALRKLITATLKLGEDAEETGRYSAMKLHGTSKPMQQLRELIAGSRARRRRCTSPATPARARNSSRDSSTNRARGRTGRSCR